MPPVNDPKSYWSRLAHLYGLLASPLRPGADDVGAMEKAMEEWAAAHPSVSPRALLLGATPGLALMRWPAGTTLLGADRNYGTVHSIWPGDEPGLRFGICANWAELPVPPASVHLAVGDGSLNCVRHPDEVRAVCRSVRATLTATGLFLLRCYIRPEQPESPKQVFAGAFGGSISTFNQFKFRLFLSLAHDGAGAVAVDDLYRVCMRFAADFPGLSAATGWPLPEIETLEAYRDSSTVHYFPSLSEFRSVLHESFQELASTTQPYPLGEHCRVFALRPRAEVPA